jgi:hypothetical protein
MKITKRLSCEGRKDRGLASVRQSLPLLRNSECTYKCYKGIKCVSLKLHVTGCSGQTTLRGLVVKPRVRRFLTILFI